jgi:hypothetical protein
MRCECARNYGCEGERTVKNVGDESAGYMPSDFMNDVSE